MPVYKGFSMIPVRDWEGVDQWTGTPRTATTARGASGQSRAGTRKKQALNGSKSTRSRTPPRAKTPARGPAGNTQPNRGDDEVTAEKAALREAAAAHRAVRAELEAALRQVQSLSEAATTKRSGASTLRDYKQPPSIACTCPAILSQDPQVRHGVKTLASTMLTKIHLLVVRRYRLESCRRCPISRSQRSNCEP